MLILMSHIEAYLKTLFDDNSETEDSDFQPILLLVDLQISGVDHVFIYK